MVGRYRTGRLSRRAAPVGSARAPRRAGRGDYRKAMDALRAPRRRRGRVPLDRRDQRIHRRNRAVDARQAIPRPPTGLTQVLFDAAEAIRLAAVLLEPIMPTSSRGDPAARRRAARRPHLDRDAPLARRRRAGARAGRAAVAAARSNRRRRPDDRPDEIRQPPAVHRGSARHLAPVGTRHARHPAPLHLAPQHPAPRHRRSRIESPSTTS